MSRQRTIHLSANALAAIRPHDALSPRINQILERYLQLTAAVDTHSADAIADMVLEWASQDKIKAREAQECAE
jgi:hypothetical protein